MTAGDTPVPQLGAHLVGSVPLESAGTVFRAAADRLGSRVTRIPDGETGDRAGWIGIQLPMLTAHPQLEYTGSRILQEGVASMPAFRLRPGTDPGALAIPSPGYADFAAASYQAFAALNHPTRTGRTLPKPPDLTSRFVFNGSSAACISVTRSVIVDGLVIAGLLPLAVVGRRRRRGRRALQGGRHASASSYLRAHPGTPDPEALDRNRPVFAGTECVGAVPHYSTVEEH